MLGRAGNGDVVVEVEVEEERYRSVDAFDCNHTSRHGNDAWYLMM